MTTPHPVDPIDDAAIGAAVRDAASAWAMPPVRLDAPGWRDRVRTPRARRVAALRGVLGRIGQAAGAAVALTLVAALAGVYLTNLGAGKPGQGSAAPSSRPSGPAAASPLPRLYQAGEPSRLGHVLLSDEGAFEVLDLATGSLGPSIGGGWYGSLAWAQPDGSVSCLCLSGDGFSRSGTATMAVAVEDFDSSGAQVANRAVATYQGAPDPRDAITPQTPQDVAVAVTHGAVAGTRLVGWTVHAHPVWHSGIDVVDVASATVVSRVTLPDRSDGDGTLRVAPVGPRFIGLSGDGRAIFDQWWMSWSPPEATNPRTNSGADVFTARISGTSLTDLRPLGAGSACGYDVVQAGPRPNGRGTWLACPSPSGGQTRLRLIDPAGAVDDIQLGVSIIGSGEGAGSIVSPDGRWLYLWDPTHLELTRVDLSDGTATTATGSASAAAGNPIAALGRWLAPATSAKVLLSPGLAIAPDGGRIYALGIEPGLGSSHDFAGSAGVLVFDTGSMRQVDHWAPLADLVSIAVSADGRDVLVAGAPATSIDGDHTSQPASVTIYDATTGDLRLIAGSLGQGFVTFPAPILP